MAERIQKKNQAVEAKTQAEMHLDRILSLEERKDLIETKEEEQKAQKTRTVE